MESLFRTEDNRRGFGQERWRKRIAFGPLRVLPVGRALKDAMAEEERMKKSTLAGFLFFLGGLVREGKGLGLYIFLIRGRRKCEPF